MLVTSFLIGGVHRFFQGVFTDFLGSAKFQLDIINRGMILIFCSDVGGGRIGFHSGFRIFIFSSRLFFFRLLLSALSLSFGRIFRFLWLLGPRRFLLGLRFFFA